jgi:hypothetical protein
MTAEAETLAATTATTAPAKTAVAATTVEAKAAAATTTADANAEAAAAAAEAEAMEATTRATQMDKGAKVAEGGNADPAHHAQNEDQNHSEVD